MGGGVTPVATCRCLADPGTSTHAGPVAVQTAAAPKLSSLRLRRSFECKVGIHPSLLFSILTYCRGRKTCPSFILNNTKSEPRHSMSRMVSGPN